MRRPAVPERAAPPGPPRATTAVHHVSVEPPSADPSDQDLDRSGLSRLRLLRLLRERPTASDGPGALGVQELAQLTGLHANTVRAHLDRLVAEGSVQRRPEQRAVPGRPRLTYFAVPRPDPQADNRSYRLLAEMLTGLISTSLPDARDASVEAGRSWGHYLAEKPAPHRRTDEAKAVQGLLTTLKEVGFSPELSGDDVSGRTVLLHSCPFLEVAEAHRDVVCAIHLGLMQGALSEMRAPVTAGRLEPFVAPSLCVAHLVGTPPAQLNS